MGGQFIKYSLNYPPGATPLDDLSDLKIEWIKNMSHLNQVEAENISIAIEKYLLKKIKPPLKWFDINFFQKVHKEMFGIVWNWAGKFRKKQTIPGIKPYLIPVALKELCDDVAFWNKNKTNTSLLEQAAIIHHKLTRVLSFFSYSKRTDLLKFLTIFCIKKFKKVYLE